MEEEEVDSELNNSTPAVESATSTPLSDDPVVDLKETVQIDNITLMTSPPEAVETPITASENADIKKKKLKEEKPHSKIVVRRLPPTMTKEMFLELVSPLPDVDYIYYIHGDPNNAVNPFSRAYLNFVNQEDLFSFSRTFDNYVFLDLKGQEYPAVVEFAMFQRIAKQRTKKKDPLMGTIEADPSFIAFKENLLAEALENSKTGGKAVKQHYFETEISTAEEVNTTPLLEFLKVRRAEKARMREERREEKKRKDLERKLKQKTRDKKGEGEEEEVPKESKMQHKLSESHEKETLVERNKAISKNDNLANKIGYCSKEKCVELKNDNCEKGTVLEDQKISILSKSDKDEDKGAGKATSNGHAESRAPSISSSGGTNSVPDAEVLKIREAEQQTIFLRKMLGLLPTGAQLPEPNKEVSHSSHCSNDSLITSSIKNVCIPEQLKNATSPSQEVLPAFKGSMPLNHSANIFWSKNNINPALPSASFKTSDSSGQDGEQRCLSAPREWKEVGDQLIKAASSTPNVFFVEGNILQPSLPIGEEVLVRDRRENKERETRTVKKRDDKERVEKTSRVREFKSRGGKSYQEERLRLAERREEQKKRELLNSGEKKPDSTELNDTDTVEVPGEHSKVPEEKTSRFEKKKFEYRKKYDNDDWKDDKKRNRNEKNNIKRDGRDRKDDYRRNQDKRMSDSERRKLNKSYKNSEFSKASEDKKKSSPAALDDAKEKNSREEEPKSKNDDKDTDMSKEKWKSVDDLVLESTVERKKSDNILTETDQSPISSKKRHSSLENIRHEETVAQESPKKVTLLQREKPEEPKENKDKSSNYRSRKELSGHKSNAEMKGYQSKKKDRFYDKADDSKGSSDSCSKNKTQEQERDGTKNRDATRPDRRIRNKDRPSIEIYRPGMGKFSKQRLEKERALGSSTEVDSPSHSPSPTPRANLAT